LRQFTPGLSDEAGWIGTYQVLGAHNGEKKTAQRSGVNAVLESAEKRKDLTNYHFVKVIRMPNEREKSKRKAKEGKGLCTVPHAQIRAAGGSDNNS